jgi:predicted dehydrogenase
MSVYWNGGGIWSRPRKEGMSDAEYQINNWYHYIWLCGDQICEQHIHNLDVMNWVMNSNPISAYGLGGRQVRKEPGQIWDHFGIEYEFANGARVHSMCRHWAQSDDNVSEFAIGTKGTSNPGGWVKTFGGQQKGFKNERSGYKQEHADLLKSIMEGKLLNEGRRVAESTLTAIMGRESCYSGRKIWWDKQAAKNAGLSGRALEGAPTAMESKLDTFPKDLTLKSELPEPPVPMPDKYEPV